MPHCATSVAPAPAMKMMAISPCASSALPPMRSMTKKPSAWPVAAWIEPEKKPNSMNGRMRGSRHDSRCRALPPRPARTAPGGAAADRRLAGGGAMAQPRIVAGDGIGRRTDDAGKMRRIIIGQVQSHRHQHRDGDQRKGEQRPGQPDPADDEQRRHRRPDDGAKPEGRGQRGQRIGAVRLAGARRDIGLGSRVGGRAEDAEQGPQRGEQRKGRHRHQQALQPGKDDDAAAEHGDAKADDADLHQPAAAANVGLAGPIGRAERPQQGRKGKDDGDQQIGDLDDPRDAGQHRLQRGIAGGDRQQHREQHGEFASGHGEAHRAQPCGTETRL